MVKEIKNRTAILAWGSLIGESSEKCDKQRAFEKHHEEWWRGGPVLPIEFSRISSSRDKALTLVIDPDNGVLTRTWCSLSKREKLEDAVCDLRTREGSLIRDIGIIDCRTNYARSHWSFVLDKVRIWADICRRNCGHVIRVGDVDNYQIARISAIEIKLRSLDFHVG